MKGIDFDQKTSTLRANNEDCSFGNFSALPRNITWQKSFDDDLEEPLSPILATENGNYLLSGNPNSWISGDKTVASKGMNDFWLVKLNPDLLGVKENQNYILKLYPNPTSGILNLGLKDQKASR